MMKPLETDRPSGHDAICFMAGPQGIHFAAGLIHAYLAADRKAPVAVAGISAGALSSAAMYRAYLDLQQAEARGEFTEPARWAWFRLYLEKLTYDPLAPIWDAIPNPVDFFAETTPVEDKSCPPQLKQDETEARHQYLRLIRLGNWLSGVSVTASDIADVIVRWVRWKEKYAVWPIQFLAFVYRCLWITLQLAFHVATAPKFAWRPLQFKNNKPLRPLRPTPLFGWRIWGGAIFWLYVLVPASVLLILLAAFWPPYRQLFAVAAFLFATVTLLGPGAFLKVLQKRKAISPILLKPLGLDQGLLHKYHLKRWLLALFDDIHLEAPSPGNTEEQARGGPFHLLLVAATLNRIEHLNTGQVWARPNRGVLIRDALVAALAPPGLFATEQSCDPQQWLTSKGREELGTNKLVLVDGAVLGSNPLPSFSNGSKRTSAGPRTVPPSRNFTRHQKALAPLCGSCTRYRSNVFRVPIP